MTDFLGAETLTGAALQPSLGTAVAATNKLKLISNGLDVDTEQKVDETLCDNAGRDLPRKGTDVLGGPLVEELQYDAQSILLEQAFGDFQVNAGDDTYEVISRTATQLTVASLLHDSVVHEYDDIRTNNLQITGTPDDDIRIVANTFGGQRTRTGTVNTPASLRLLPDPGVTVRFNEMRLRIGDLADALGASDEWQEQVNAFTIDFNRNMVQNRVGSEFPATATENGKRDVTFSITLVQFDTELFIDWKENRTNIQAELHFAEFGGTRTKTFRFPVGRVTVAPKNIAGPALQSTTIEMMFALNKGRNAFTDFDFANEIQGFENAA